MGGPGIAGEALGRPRVRPPPRAQALSPSQGFANALGSGFSVARVVIVPTTLERRAFAGEWDEVRAELEAAGHVVACELPVEQRGGLAHIVYETAIRLSDAAVLGSLLQILDGVLRDRWQKRASVVVYGPNGDVLTIVELLERAVG